jgi:hypothetical protein
MPDSPDYRLYLESEFKGLHSLMNAQFETVHERLDAIEKQTTKTNGRVSELEEEVHKELPHTKDGCPQKNVIEAIHDIVIGEEAILKRKLSEGEMKHAITVRWIMISGIIVSILISLLGTFYSRGNHQQTMDLKNEVDMINTPVRTRDGSIKFYPSGVVIDSLNKINNGTHPNP